MSLWLRIIIISYKKEIPRSRIDAKVRIRAKAASNFGIQILKEQRFIRNKKLVANQFFASKERGQYKNSYEMSADN